MISRISGKVIEKGAQHLLIGIGGMCYEVLVPATVLQRLDENLTPEGTITLETYHYLQMEPSKTFPVLVGFLNEIEKDFFGIFITVSGIGPRGALRALNKPISLIARAIDEADVAFLKSLPGIGTQRAKEIIAKLQNKVGKFGLIQDSGVKEGVLSAGRDISEEALAVLTQLGYKRKEALDMIRKAISISPDASTTEELLNVVYKQRRAE